tara:strand:+ start:1535 stop:1819 length:285 start_codon:yes stop_codon:yes gene_type:complete
MLDDIDQCTHDIKMRLIELGFEMTPPTRLYNNKLKQLQHDFIEISKAFHQIPTDIFNNAQNIFFVCTGKWHTINNLHNLSTAAKCTKEYLNKYF